MLAFALVFTGIQAVRCGLASAVKLEALIRQKGVINNYYANARAENNVLKDKISLYRSSLGVEELARERLELVGKDEILVRLYPAAVASR